MEIIIGSYLNEKGDNDGIACEWEMGLMIRSPVNTVCLNSCTLYGSTSTSGLTRLLKLSRALLFIKISVLTIYLHIFQPSNIFFSLDGYVKVGDFGLVTATEEQCLDEVEINDRRCGIHRHTDQVGTKMYMSPEQVSRIT